jgi:hypothetical protein
MSRSAVSCEHFVNAAHFDVVSFPSKPAVEAVRAPLRSRQRHVGEGPVDPAVAVVERIDGHKPEMRLRRLEHRIDRRVGVEPGDEALHRAAAPGRKERRMPPEQPLVRQRLLVVPGRVEHHLDDAVDMAVG